MYINIDTLKMYNFSGEIFDDYPNVSFPMGNLADTFRELGIEEVYCERAPEVGFFEKVVKLPVAFDMADGKWKIKWEIVPVARSESEIEQEEKRILSILTEAIQEHLDLKPKERLYDGIVSLCTYATSKNPIRAKEGQSGVEWRDACWDKGYEIMAEVKAGERAIPTAEELLTEMPVFIWPDEELPQVA